MRSGPRQFTFEDGVSVARISTAWYLRRNIRCLWQLQEQRALYNAALFDQRKVPEVIRKFFDSVNENSTGVGALGDSAGAGPIVHYLVFIDRR